MNSQSSSGSGKSRSAISYLCEQGLATGVDCTAHFEAQRRAAFANPRNDLEAMTPQQYLTQAHQMLESGERTMDDIYLDLHRRHEAGFFHQSDMSQILDSNGDLRPAPAVQPGGLTP